MSDDLPRSPNGDHIMPKRDCLVDIPNCARCTYAHEKLLAKPFWNPIAPRELDFAWTHWAMCPRLIEPILIAGGPDTEEVTP